MKYIRTKDNEFVIFSASINHSDMARMMRVEPISAGFVNIYGETVSAHGRSMTLHMSALPEDSDLIRSQIKQY